MTNTFDKDRAEKIKRAITDEFAVAVAEFYLDGTQVAGRLEFVEAAMRAGAGNANLIGIRDIEGHPLGHSTGISFSLFGNDYKHSVWLDFIPAEEYLIERADKRIAAIRAESRASQIQQIKNLGWLIAFGVACFLGMVVIVGLPA